MNFDEDLKNNPWAQYIGINSENLGEINPESQEDTELPPPDIEVHGACPVYEELHLVKCNKCQKLLLPSSVMNHIETRHGLEERIITSIPSTSSSSSNASASSSRSCTVTTPSSWTPSTDTSHGAVLPSSVNVNTSANIIRVRPEKPSLKVETPLNHKHSKPSFVTLKKNVQRKELSQKTVVMLPDASNIPSTSTNILPHASNSSQLIESSSSCDNKFSKDSVHDSVPSTSTSSEKPMDCSEASTNEKKTPTLEKLVLRRVLQTGEKTPAVRRQSVEGMKGVARNKKDASKEPYFMVVKKKDREQNLLATRQHIRKQSNVVHQEKDKVEKKMKHLESIRDKLINQLIQELQYVKQKLNESNSSNAVLRKELLFFKEETEKGSSKEEENKRLKLELEESKKMAKENELLAEQNRRCKEQIQKLQDQVEYLTNSLLQHAELYATHRNESINSERLAQQLQAVREQKAQYQRQLDEMETQLREFKESSELQKETLENKLQKYVYILKEMQKKLALLEARNKDLLMHKQLLEQHLSQETLYQVKSQYAAFSRQQEIFELYPGMIQNTTSIATPSVPLTEKMITDIKNNYLTFQHQGTDDRDEIFQQTVNEEIS